MRRTSALWLATDAMESVLYLRMKVEGWLEDCDGALAAGDATTAAECSYMVEHGLAVASLVLQGAGAVQDETEILALLLVDGPAALRTYTDGPIIDADHAAVEERVELLRQRFDEALGSSPIDLPQMRSPDGFFPSVRVAAQLEQLRASLGLPPYPWEMVRRG